MQIDPKAVVQTGPGLPDWGKNGPGYQFSWNGPVHRAQTVRLYLIGPSVNLLLALLRIFGLVMLLLVFLRRRGWLLRKGAAAAAAFVLFMLTIPRPGNAQNFPSPDLLTELDKRLQRDRCHNDCTSASHMILRAAGDALTIEGELNSDGPGAYPLPGPLSELRVRRVELDGAETVAVRRDERGVLWVRVPDGTHLLKAAADLAPKNSITLQFALSPRHLQVDSAEWNVDGIGPTGRAGSSIQMLRKLAQPETAAQQEREVTLPEWYRVTRRIQIGIPWGVETTVARLGSKERSQIIKVPLLKGEAVTTPGVKVDARSALAAFARGAAVVSWSSSLEERADLKLRAPVRESFTEDWKLDCSAVFHCEHEGLIPKSTIENGENVVSWQPWPGDRARIKISRPQGVEGQARTIDKVSLDYRPGQRLLQGHLQLNIRSSQGGWQKVLLAEGMEVEKVTVDGSEKRIRPEDRELALPLSPGSRSYQIDWRSESPLTVWQTLPKLALPGGAVNITTTVHAPSKRWMLWARGPKWGPVFLYWGELLVIILAALLLGVRRISGLNARQWILLGLGLSMLPTALMVVPPLWLWALSYRKTNAPEQRWLFNGMQLLLVFLTAAALGVFYGAVAVGLVGSPDMSIAGYGSGNFSLRWYLDRSVSGALPAPAVLSLPLWVWRVLMFIWAVWLVSALIKWLRWGWGCFSAGGLWRSKTVIAEP